MFSSQTSAAAPAQSQTRNRAFKLERRLTTRAQRREDSQRTGSASILSARPRYATMKYRFGNAVWIPANAKSQKERFLLKAVTRLELEEGQVAVAVKNRAWTSP